METQVKYPDIKVELSDQSGNAYAIIGRVRKAMKRAMLPTAEIEAFTDEATSDDYDHLLQVVIRTVCTR